MNTEPMDILLKRVRLRKIPDAQLSRYTDEVRRRLAVQPSTVSRVPACPTGAVGRRPALPWSHHLQAVARRATLLLQAASHWLALQVVGWWRVLASLGAVAALATMLVLRTPVRRPLMFAEDTSIADEIAVLNIVAPEESILPEDDAAFLEEIETLEAEPSSES